MSLRATRRVIGWAAAACALGVALAVPADTTDTRPSDATASRRAVDERVDRFFALEGCWRGKGPDGLAVEAAYRFDDSKTTLLESIRLEDRYPSFVLYRFEDGELSAKVFGTREQPARSLTAAIDDGTDDGTDDGDIHFRGSSAAAGLVGLRFHLAGLDRFELHREWREGDDTRARPFLFRRVFDGCDPRQRSADW